MSSPSTGTSTAACGFPSDECTTHKRAGARARATHTHTPNRPGLRNAGFRWYVRSPPSSPSAAAALPLFLSGRPFTIGNLHKRLTEARLNHTREREKNRRASEVFVRGGARVTRSRSRSGAERRRRQRKRKKADREEKRRWKRKKKRRRRDKEGAKALADGGESLRRVARRSYRRYHGGSALSSKSVSSLPPAPLPAHRVHLRNNTWYTVPRSPPYPGYAPYTVRNNVTVGW